MLELLLYVLLSIVGPLKCCLVWLWKFSPSIPLLEVSLKKHATVVPTVPNRLKPFDICIIKTGPPMLKAVLIYLALRHLIWRSFN